MTAPRRVPPQAAGRRGWCPSLARPMPTGDGLLARIHPPLGILGVAQMRAVAEGARRFGNGHVDVTARANLQIRGVGEATKAALAAHLAAVGLGDVRDDGGPQRLTLTPPLAGPDAMALARAIEAIGLSVPGLPAKTLVAVEEAQPFGPSLAGIDADIRLVLDNAAPFPGRTERQRNPIRGPARTAAQRHLALSSEDARFPPPSQVGPARLGHQSADLGQARDPWGEGSRTRPSRSTGNSTTPFILALAGPDRSDRFTCPDLEAAIAAVDAALQALAGSGGRRMRDLPPADRAALVGLLGLAPLPPQAEASAATACGLTAFGAGRMALAVGSPFGRCGADGLDRLADEAEALASQIHLSPSRGFVLVSMDLAASERARDALAEAGFITGADDPRAALAACPGAPACASGSTATLKDAARLAEAFRPFAERGLRAHVSGCAKGCAHPAAAGLTLVGEGGLYGIVLDGAPAALPAMQLTFEAALERLRRADPATPLSDAFRTNP